MANETPQQHIVTPSGHPVQPPMKDEIRIISHSHLFYWWPVWAVGFLMAILTFIDGSHMTVVPKDAKVEKAATVVPKEKEGETLRSRDVIVLPEGTHLVDKPEKKGEYKAPALHMANHNSYGVIYAIILLLVIMITNVPLRGLWSVVVIVIIVLGSIIFYLADWWESIFRAFSDLSIQINAGGYLTISIALAIIWAVTVYFFDKQLYMIFTPGQLKVCLEIGGGEKAYDTAGMTVEKQRSDLFRHWILGLGSGDLIVNTSGSQAHHFDLPNVLFIGRKVRAIEDMLREKAVVRGNA